MRHPSLQLDEGRLWSHRGSFSLAGGSYPVLSDEHEVVFAVLSLLRDIERGRGKIKNVLDLIQLVAALDAQLDWDAVLEHGRREGTFGALVNVLPLCLELAGAQDLAPRLTTALAACVDRRVPARPAGPPLRFAPTRFDLGNRFWSARTYDTPLTLWWLWWATGLPFRRAAHRWPRPRQSAREPAGDASTSTVARIEP
jgi:hypothetical protein